MKVIITALFVSCLLVPFLSNKSVAQQAKSEIKILFIGNSYTYVNDLPGIFASLARAKGKTVLVKDFTVSSYSFKKHKNSRETLSAIKSNNWDFIVLQNHSQIPSLKPGVVRSSSLPNAIDLVNKIHSHNVETQIVYFVTWGRKNGDTDNCANYSKVCDFYGHTEAVNQGYKMYQGTTGGILANVGQQWLNVINDTSASDNLKDLWSADNTHPSYKGSYLAASTIYAAIFGESSKGASFYGKLGKNEAIYYQQISSN